ncbi:A24 family peptidase [Novosphingobium clariflavum]|uniref:Prepilin peptidase n=1 Tax=Novosphingobium clariflavum TaxID=2029884 RepID=A0ABV6S8Z4_9SPHN|nr:prepilin peptidase [Novosphingobium clariflavum]
MQSAYFSYALLAALATALVVAAVTDIKRREIANRLNAGIALAAPLWWLSIGLGWTGIGIQIGLALATFAICCVLFVLRQMGGGDVKLLAALALWFAPAPFLQLIVLMAVVGGGASVAMAAFNMERRPGEALCDIGAWLVAAGWTFVAAAMAWALATGRPLISPELVDSLLSSSRSPALVAAGTLLGLLALFALGFFHIKRRQKSRLRVPYGVAIAAAGLWVAAATGISAFHAAPVLG